jgi:hypothetical protein
MAIALCLFVLRLAAAELPTESQIYAAVVADVERAAAGTATGAGLGAADGALSPAEYARVGEITPFDAIDADHNGAIDGAELASYTERTPITLRVGTIFAGPRTIPTGSPPSGRGWRLAGVALAVAVVAVGIGALSGRRSGRRRRGRG